MFFWPWSLSARPSISLGCLAPGRPTTCKPRPRRCLRATLLKTKGFGHRKAQIYRKIQYFAASRNRPPPSLTQLFRPFPGGPPGLTEKFGNRCKTRGSRRPPPPLTLLFRPFAYNWLRCVFLRFFRSRPNLAQGVSKRCFSVFGRSPPPQCNQWPHGRCNQ